MGARAARALRCCPAVPDERIAPRARRGSDDDEGAGRGPRAAPVREPEPINDFERARLENIRRNQEALAGELPPAAAARAAARP